MNDKSQSSNSFSAAVIEKTRAKTRLQRTCARLHRQWRYWYVRLRRLRGTNRSIARGFAVGVFAGFFPLFGLQTIIGVGLAILVRGSKLAAAAGTWISNPLTDIFIYAFTFKIGQLVLGWNGLSLEGLSLQSWEAFVEAGTAVIIPMLVGCFIAGMVAAFLTYFLTLWLYTRGRRKLRRSRFSSRRPTF